MAKIMEVARRIMRGAIVPASDEKKLMEYSEEIYQTAKSVGAMVRRQKRKRRNTTIPRKWQRMRKRQTALRLWLLRM